MKNVFFCLLALLFTAPALARSPDFQGMVTLKNGQKIHMIHYQARAQAPTVVLLNGLTYTTAPWQKTIDELADSDLGVLVYDMRGMGKSLEATGPAKDIIPLDQQVADLALLLNQRGLKRVTLAGLSYGGAVGLAFTAKHPERVDKLILLAPYVKALKAQDDYLQNQVRMHRTMYPYDKRTDDQIYDHYLRAFIHKTYPIYEPVVREHPWRLDAVVQMVRGVRKFKATEIAGALPSGKIHLVVGGQDQYVPLADHNEFWNSLGKNQKMSRILIKGAEHKLPESVPHFLGGWMKLILMGDRRVGGGRDFVGEPSQGSATTSGFRIDDLPRD